MVLAYAKVCLTWSNISFIFPSNFTHPSVFKHKFDSLNIYPAPCQYLMDSSNVFDKKFRLSNLFAKGAQVTFETNLNEKCAWVNALLHIYQNYRVYNIKNYHTKCNYFD